MSVVKNLKTLVSDSVIYGLSNALSKFITIFLVPIYTSIFSPSDYGVMSVLNNTYWLICLVLVLGLDNSTARWFYDTEDAAERKKIINSWFWFFLLISGISGVALFACSKPLSHLLFGGDKAAYYFKLLSLILPFISVVTITTNVLRFERRVYATVAVTLAQNLTFIGFNILFVVYYRMGLAGIYYSQLISTLLSFLLGVIMLRKWITKPYVNKKLLKDMIKYSLPFVPATIGYWVINLSGTFFINHFRGESEAGLFQIGVSVVSGAALITTAFQQAWSPFAFSILKQKDAKEIYAKVLLIYSMFMLTVVLGLSLFGKEVLMIFTNHQYYGAASVISILAFAQFFIGTVYIADIGAAIAKQTRPLGFILTVSALLYPVFSIILVPAFGKEGAALTTCISQVMIAVYMFYRSQKLYYIPYNFSYAFGILAICITMALLSANISWIGNSIPLKITLLVLFCTIIAAKLLTSDYIKVVKNFR